MLEWTPHAVVIQGGFCCEPISSWYPALRPPTDMASLGLDAKDNGMPPGARDRHPSEHGCFLRMTGDVLWEVLVYLDLSHKFILRAVCRALRSSCDSHLAALQTVTLDTFRTTPGPQTTATNPFPYAFITMGLPLCQNLRVLNLSGLQEYMDDLACQCLRDAAVPTLQELDISSCPGVTNLGVYILFTRGPLRTSLQYLDITFTSTNYSVVLKLRAIRPDLTIRRQPKWLDGHFQCPWSEVHTYHADGSFTFTRDRESKGFVWTLTDHGHYYSDKLQYLNAYMLPHTLFRPGVLLKRAPDHVLVAQARWQLDPPRDMPPATLYEDLPIGQSMQIATEEGLVLVSKMNVMALKPQEVNPPKDLVDEIQQYADENFLASDFLSLEEYDIEAAKGVHCGSDHPLVRLCPSIKACPQEMEGGPTC